MARAHTFARQKIIIKEIYNFVSVFFIENFMKMPILWSRARLRALLMCALKNLINIDAFCTFKRQNIWKIHEISAKSFSARNSKWSKILKNKNPDFLSWLIS